MNYNEKENNRRWFVIGLLFNLLMIGVYVGTVSTISNYYNNTTGVSNHSNLTNLQGGLSPDEYYHLNSSFYSALTGMKECGLSPSYYYALKYINGSFTCISIPIDDDSWQSSKVNKSGDVMTASLFVPDINGRNMSLSSNLSTLQRNGSLHTNKIIKYENSTGSNITSSQVDYYYTHLFNANNNVLNGVNLISFQSVNDAGWPYFLGRRARGTDYGNGTARLSALKENDPMIGYNGAGYDNGTGWSGSRVSMSFLASQDWTTSANGAKILFATTNNNTNVIASTKMTLHDSGKLELTSLVGTGNAYVCVYSNGTLYRGSPTC